MDILRILAFVAFVVGAIFFFLSTSRGANPSDIADGLICVCIGLALFCVEGLHYFTRTPRQ